VVVQLRLQLSSRHIKDVTACGGVLLTHLHLLLLLLLLLVVVMVVLLDVVAGGTLLSGRRWLLLPIMFKHASQQGVTLPGRPCICK
jgi:hypothetical protein